MRDPERNITSNLDDSQWRDFRSNVIGIKRRPERLIITIEDQITFYSEILSEHLNFFNS